jgi:predicted site-specific integrase-resolvase
MDQRNYTANGARYHQAYNKLLQMGKCVNTQEPAVSYFCTSSAANVGADKDSLKRQRAVIETFAARQGLRVVGDFYDSAVSGADAIEDRSGFAALLDRIETNGVRTVIVEDVSRFAREMKAHVLGIALLRERGVRLLSACDGQNLTEDTDEMTEGMVTIMAVFAQIEKKRLVKKLRSGSGPKISTGGEADRRSQKLSRNESGTRADGQAACPRQSQRATFASRYFFKTSGEGLHHQPGHAILSCPDQTSLGLIGVRFEPQTRLYDRTQPFPLMTQSGHRCEISRDLLLLSSTAPRLASSPAFRGWQS